MAPSLYRVHVGLDIAATTFMAARFVTGAEKPDRSQRFTQSADGFAALKAHLLATDVPPSAIHSVLEATRTYWIGVATYLHTAGFVVRVLSGGRLHNFAKAHRQRVKTDAIDAQLLAQFAAQMSVPVWSPPPHAYHELPQRLAQRESLLHLRQQVRNQRHALTSGVVVMESVRVRMDTRITTLTEQIAAVETEIAEAAQYDKTWAASITLRQTIPGMSVLSACWLVVSTLNFTSFATVEAVTHYAGLAPELHESGTRVRGRPQIGHGGNARLRRMLYMCTLSATRYNPPVKALYTRLKAKGKAEKVARCAAARKLLHIAYAVVTTQTAFDPEFGHLAPAA